MHLVVILSTSFLPSNDWYIHVDLMAISKSIRIAGKQSQDGIYGLAAVPLKLENVDIKKIKRPILIKDIKQGHFRCCL